VAKEAAEKNEERTKSLPATGIPSNVCAFK
jgi:hypothetical protein